MSDVGAAPGYVFTSSTRYMKKKEREKVENPAVKQQTLESTGAWFSFFRLSHFILVPLLP